MTMTVAPFCDQGSEHAQQRAHVQRVQADGRLVKDKHCVMLGPAHLAGQLQPLCLAAGQARRFLAQRQVAKAQILQRLKRCVTNFKSVQTVSAVLMSMSMSCGSVQVPPCLFSCRTAVTASRL